VAFYGVGSLDTSLTKAGVGGFGNGGFGAVVTHGVAGGLISVAGGGKFASGFLAAGFGEEFGPDPSRGLTIDAIAQAAVAGGVGSVIGGGKFENGAITGAFGYLFNDALHGDARHYDPNDPNYHFYQFSNPICSIDEAGCTPQNVFDSLRLFAAPGQEDPAYTGGHVTVPFAGQITQFVDGDGLSVYNVTADGHMFDPGYVMRSVVSSYGVISVQTTGEGTGAYRLFNVDIARPAFTTLDAAIRAVTVPLSAPTQ
jgi:hypothetical protein